VSFRALGGKRLFALYQRQAINRQSQASGQGSQLIQIVEVIDCAAPGLETEEHDTHRTIIASDGHRKSGTIAPQVRFEFRCNRVLVQFRIVRPDSRLVFEVCPDRLENLLGQVGRIGLVPLDNPGSIFRGPEEDDGASGSEHFSCDIDGLLRQRFDVEYFAGRFLETGYDLSSTLALGRKQGRSQGA